MMRAIGGWLRRRAENVAAAMLAVMFAAFVVQIAFRYFLNYPIGWTSELTVVMWLWLVLWGAAFVVKESEEIRFDLLSGAVGRRARIAMGLVAALALVVLYAASLPATYDYVTFMKVEKSGLPQDPLRLALFDLPGLRRRDPRALPLDTVASAARRGAGRSRSDPGELRPMNPASPFSLAVLAIVALSLLGLPIGHAMIAGSILYLWLAGLDMGTAAEQLLNGMYTSYLLLAVPLFILAAEFMNSGSMTDRLLRFCDALVGRFRGGLAQVNVVQSIIFAGMSGSALADAAGTGKLMQTMMTQDGKYTRELRRRADRRVRGHRPDHSAVDPDGALRAGLRHLDRLPLPRRDRSRAADRRSCRWASSPSRQAAEFPGRAAGAAARAAAHHAGRPFPRC